MSKSLKRVIATAENLGLQIEAIKMDVPTNTAQQAADAIGADVQQIAKSVIFRGQTSDQVFMFLTAGGNRVDVNRASAITEEPLGKADAAYIREKTGFAIGGVSPIGHTGPVKIFWDETLSQFDEIWAAAGTPHHMFAIAPGKLRESIGAIEAHFIQTD